MPDPQKIIGYDPDTGKAVVGYDPNSGKMVYDDTGKPVYADQSVAPRNLAEQFAQDHPNEPPTESFGRGVLRQAPTLAAMGAAALTGGASAPISAAATGGAAALGSLVRSAFDDTPETMGQAVGTAATQGLLNAGLQYGASKLVQKAPAMIDSARRWYTNVFLPKEATLKSVRTDAGALTASKPEAQRILADRLIARRARPNETSLGKAQGQFDTLDDQLATVVADNPNAAGKPLEVIRGLRRLESYYRGQGLPEADTAAARGAQAEFMRNPAVTEPKLAPKVMPSTILGPTGQPLGSVTTMVPAGRQLKEVTAAELMQLLKGTQQSASRGYGALSPASLEATKAVGHGLRETVARVLPEAMPIKAQQSQLVPVLKAIEDATTRLGRKADFGWGDVLAAVLNPKAIMATAVTHPSVKLAIADLTKLAASGAAMTPQALQLLRASILASSPTPSHAPAVPPR